jgi:RNA-directed DNA polymerase
MGQQSHSVMATKLNRIAWLSKQDSEKEFECLMHLFNIESLTECFHQLDKNKAMGIDGINKESYAINLENNIKELIKKMKDMAYRPGPAIINCWKISLKKKLRIRSL